MSIDKYRFTEYELFDFLELLIGVLSLISSVIAIWAFWQNPTNKIQFFVIISILALCLIFFLKIKKLQKVGQDRLQNFSQAFHRFSDLIRDELYSLSAQYEAGKLTLGHLRSEAENVGQIAVDLLADVLSSSTGKKVCVCIKYFSDDFPREEDKDLQEEDYFLTTLCRSSNSDPHRKVGELTPVKGNTAFLKVMNERKSFFRARDIHALDKKLREAGSERYQNPNHDWESRYLSTIVVPIRIREHSKDGIAGVGYDLIGFLCADSLSTSALRDHQMDDYTHLIKAFASGLYMYLDQILLYKYNLSEEG